MRRSNRINKIATLPSAARNDSMNVCIVGVGLIGGSLGMALRRVRKNGQRSYMVLGWGRKASQLRLARKRGAIDHFDSRASHVIPLADIIVLAVPVQDMGSVVKKILPFIKKGALITDVGSVKKPVIEAARAALARRRDLKFVGAHPIAGSEKTGVENARMDLFKNAACVVTTDRAKSSDRSVIAKIWSDAGAKVVSISADDHDQLLSLTSHLPHLISFAFFSLVHQTEKKFPVLRQLVGGSFRDMTRVAASDPRLWSGILESNHGPLISGAKDFQKSLSQMSRLRKNQLLKTLASLSSARRKW